MPDAAGIEPSRERLAHIEEKRQRRAEEFALVILQCLPETDTGVNVFGKLDERDCQFVERVIVELARRVNEHFLRFRNHATQRQSQAGKPLVQSTGTYRWTVGFDRCFEILLSGHLSINSWSSFLGKGFADLISFHGAMPGGGLAVRDWVPYGRTSHLTVSIPEEMGWNRLFYPQSKKRLSFVESVRKSGVKPPCALALAFVVAA